MHRRLILASASPRRRDLLSLLGLPFEVIPSGLEETVPRAAPRALAERLAQGKALEVWSAIQDRGAIVLGADTIVAVGPTTNPVLLGKPSNAEDAREMLRQLSRAKHTVCTGVAIARQSEDGGDVEITSEVISTMVTFRELPPELIDAYVATGDCYDKAGAYGIQGFASTFVESIHGDYFNVVGLPVQTVARMLERIGVEWWRGADALSWRQCH
jgi:septum formation protein